MQRRLSLRPYSGKHNYINENEQNSISLSFSAPVKYTVFFTKNAFDSYNHTLDNTLCIDRKTRPHRVFAIFDSGVLAANPTINQKLVDYLKARRDSLILVAPPLIVPGGERAKENPRWVRLIQRKLYQFHVDRHAIVLILGGGAVLDMAGFAAATTHRGVRTVRMPTTVLSQADGGLGVKTGVNSFGVKNFLGTFTAPFAIINDSGFLGTLPSRQVISGMAEAIKVALIRDARFFTWLETNADSLRTLHPTSLDFLIKKSASIHLHHIASSGDPFELGSVRPLDFGHWAAHKLEALSSYELNHGEAVAIGIAIDARYSTEIGLLQQTDLQRILALFDKLGLPTWNDVCDLRGSDGQPRILRGLEEFKEHIGGDLTLTLLEQIGKGKETNMINLSIMKRSLSWLQKRHAGLCVSK